MKKTLILFMLIMVIFGGCDLKVKLNQGDDTAQTEEISTNDSGVYISSVKNGVPIFTNNRAVPGGVTWNGMSAVEVKVDSLSNSIDTLYRLTNNLESRAWHGAPHRGKVKGRDEWRYGAVSRAPMGWMYFEEDSLDISKQMWDNEIIEGSLGVYFPYLSSWLEEEVYEGDIFNIITDYAHPGLHVIGDFMVEIKNVNSIPTIELRDKDNEIICEGCSLYYIMQNSFRFDKVGNAYDNPELLEDE